MLGTSLSLTRCGRPARSGATPPGPGPGPLTDPNVTAIGADGWRATHAAPPAAFDPVADPRPVVVERPGFDAAGQPATVTDTLTVMARVREPYPDQASLTPDDVALSDFVYQGDTVDGVANNSTRACPVPLGLWLDHDLRRATGGSYTARLAVAHAHARNGRPVAAVKFTASDGTTTVETTVSAMSVASYAGSGLSVPHFAGTLDFSALDPDALITVDAVIYPWVGAAFTLSADADAYPSVNLTTLRVLNDVGYGTAYAHVDAASGDDGSGVASETPATAQAAPFATIAAAAQAIQTYNTASFGRNNADAGIIRLEEGTHTFAALGVATAAVPLEIEAVGARAATVLQDAGGHTFTSLPARTVIRGVTLKRNAAGTVVFLDSSAGAGAANMLVIEGCAFDDAGLGPSWGAWIYQTGRTWLIDCGGVDAGQARLFSTDFKAIIAIGCGAGSVQTTTYHAAGCRDLAAGYAMSDGAGARPAHTGPFVGWSHLGRADGVTVVSMTRAPGARGAALIGTVIEQAGGDTENVVGLWADGNTVPAENVVRIGNTLVGGRINALYQDTGSTTIPKTGIERFNVDRQRNTKSDVFGQDGNLVGNWPVIHRVGARANATLVGGNDGQPPGAGRWLGELAAFGEANGSAAAPLDPDWADDASGDGSGLGGGDYTPGPGHALPAIPAGLAPWSHDQQGRAIADDGSAVAGALQPL